MLLHSWWECKLIQPLWKMVWRFLKKLEIKPSHDPAIQLLGIYPEETKIEKDTCIPVFIAALFTIARTWKQPRCPLADEWIRRVWYIQGRWDPDSLRPALRLGGQATAGERSPGRSLQKCSGNFPT